MNERSKINSIKHTSIKAKEALKEYFNKKSKDIESPVESIDIANFLHPKDFGKAVKARLFELNRDDIYMDRAMDCIYRADKRGLGNYVGIDFAEYVPIIDFARNIDVYIKGRSNLTLVLDSMAVVNQLINNIIAEKSTKDVARAMSGLFSDKYYDINSVNNVSVAMLYWLMDEENKEYHKCGLFIIKIMETCMELVENYEDSDIDFDFKFSVVNAISPLVSAMHALADGDTLEMIDDSSITRRAVDDLKLAKNIFVKDTKSMIEDLSEDVRSILDDNSLEYNSIGGAFVLSLAIHLDAITEISQSDFTRIASILGSLGKKIDDLFGTGKR